MNRCRAEAVVAAIALQVVVAGLRMGAEHGSGPFATGQRVVLAPLLCQDDKQLRVIQHSSTVNAFL